MVKPATASLRTRALEEALRIADSEGLDALSIRRLADGLGVKGASLYHHFKDKDEILDGVAFLALSDLGPPDDEALPWIDWLLQVARSYRQALLASVTAQWKAQGKDRHDTPAAAALFLLVWIPRMVTLEESLGTQTGHAETLTLVHRFLDDVEPLDRP